MQMLREHPVLTAICVLLTVTGAVSALWLAPAEWSLARQLGAGAFTGLLMAICLVASRLLGAFDADRDGG